MLNDTFSFTGGASSWYWLSSGSSGGLPAEAPQFLTLSVAAHSTALGSEHGWPRAAEHQWQVC